jgi:hypothetical protein
MSTSTQPIPTARLHRPSYSRRSVRQGELLPAAHAEGPCRRGASTPSSPVKRWSNHLSNYRSNDGSNDWSNCGVPRRLPRHHPGCRLRAPPPRLGRAARLSPSEPKECAPPVRAGRTGGPAQLSHEDGNSEPINQRRKYRPRHPAAAFLPQPSRARPPRDTGPGGSAQRVANSPQASAALFARAGAAGLGKKPIRVDSGGPGSRQCQAVRSHPRPAIIIIIMLLY